MNTMPMFRLIVENLSTKTSWQDLKDFMRQVIYVYSIIILITLNLILKNHINAINLYLF